MRALVIGIDTNILVRWITQDDPLQCERVEELFQKHYSPEGIFLSDIVLIELEWVLSYIYEFKREEIYTVFKMIARTSQFSFRNKETIIQALENYRSGERGFSDCMIGELGYEQSVKTYTFDKALNKDSNFIVL